MELKNFSKRLKKRRLELGLTQEELANRLFVTKKAVSRWETGRGLPDVSLLPELANALGITIDELFNANENEVRDYYREFHEKVDEHTLYVQSYEKQGRVLTLFKGITLVLVGVIVALTVFAVNYHNAYLGALLRKEYTLLWRDYAKADSTWQEQTFTAEEIKENYSYTIQGEVGSCIVVAFGGTTYDADGEVVFKESYEGWQELYQEGEKKVYHSEYMPCEYVFDSKTELKTAFSEVENIIFCSSWGTHRIEYGKSGYRGPTLFLNVSIPEDNRQHVVLSYTTTIGERVETQWFAEQTFREVVKEITAQPRGNISFGLWSEGVGWTDFISIDPQFRNKDEVETFQSWSEGGRLNVMYLSPYGGWVQSFPNVIGHVYRVRIEFIGSQKYRSCSLDFDLYIE